MGSVCSSLLQITGANVLVYIAVLPIILIMSCSPNNFLGGVAIAFVYGYFGTFEGTLLNWYPIKASMILMDPECGVENGMSYHPLPAIFILLAIIGCSILLLAKKGRKPQILVATKKKKKDGQKTRLVSK